LRALAEGRNVIWDISMAAQHTVESWLAAHRAASYAIHGIFVELSIEESVRRSAAMHRRGHDEYRQGRGYGGRFVPARAIRALAVPNALPPGDTDDVGGLSSVLVQVTSGEPVSTGGVTGMIRSYVSGVLTLDALCWKFRRRRWVAVPSACPVGLEAAAAAIDDPEPYVPGSFDEVVRAYDLGWISDSDYEALAAAAAASVRKHTG
jgi:hypothetical protein